MADLAVTSVLIGWPCFVTVRTFSSVFFLAQNSAWQSVECYSSFPIHPVLVINCIHLAYNRWRVHLYRCIVEAKLCVCLVESHVWRYHTLAFEIPSSFFFPHSCSSVFCLSNLSGFNKNWKVLRLSLVKPLKTNKAVLKGEMQYLSGKSTSGHTEDIQVNQQYFWLKGSQMDDDLKDVCSQAEQQNSGLWLVHL